MGERNKQLLGDDCGREGRDMLALPRQAKSIRTMRQTKSKGHGGTMLELAEKI